MDDPICDPATFRKHCKRLLEGEVAYACFGQVLAQARARDLLSDGHFNVHGTLIAAWAGQKSIKRKTPETPPTPPDDPGNPSIDFREERRTHASLLPPQIPRPTCPKRPGRRKPSWPIGDIGS